MIRIFRRSVTCLVVFCILLTAVGVLSPHGILPLTLERAGTAQYQLRVSGRSFRLDLRPVQNVIRYLVRMGEKIRSALPAWLSHLRGKIAEAWKNCIGAFGFWRKEPEQIDAKEPNNARFAFTNHGNYDTMI